jgi:site-specific recombinase XerD
MAELAITRWVSDLRLPNYQWDFEAFAAYVALHHGLQHLCDVTPAQAEAFVAFPHVAPGGIRPAAPTTQNQRRSTVRLLYRVARRLRLAEFDPTVDLKLPPRTGRATRPLTEEEIELGRSFALSTVRETQGPAAWALAEATATTIECGCILISDIDLARNRAWIHGTARRVPRWVDLTEWGAKQLERRLQAFSRQGIQDGRVLARDASTTLSAANSAQFVITRALARSGLGEDATVRPASVSAWRGAHEFFEHHATLDQVAKLLGVRTLDSAASMIGYEWRRGEPSMSTRGGAASSTETGRY